MTNEGRSSNDEELRYADFELSLRICHLRFLSSFGFCHSPMARSAPDWDSARC